MLKKILSAFTLSLLFLLGTYAIQSATDRIGEAEASQKTTGAPTGTFQRMIVENGSVTIDLDLDALNPQSFPGSLTARPVSLQFAVAANSFFPILVFNNLLRAAEPGSMALIPAEAAPNAFGKSSVSQTTSGLAGPLQLKASINQLVIEKLASNQAFDLAVRDGKTGFTFFNVEGADYSYDANAQALSITGGRLLISKEFANALGRPSDAGAIVGKISVGAAMQPIEIDQLVNGEPKSVVMPALGTVPGPDVIVGDLIGLEQEDNGAVNGKVGLALGTDACNKGTEDAAWIALPSNNHPFIPQNLYRMSGGGDNTLRFEQIGQSWGKHAFAAASQDTCGFGCNGVNGDHLGSGCSDAYGAFLNGLQDQIGSRAWVNPFTGDFPSGNTANDHSGHSHDVTSHRILVDVNDLNTSMNPGATYFAEANYIVPDEGIWCQAHPDQCNMYNNASYRQYTVTGINQPFSFTPVGNTVREQPAITAWNNATVTQIEPDHGNDGIWFMAYKVTRVSPFESVWLYEYALYNQNLDRGIRSFSVPLGPGAEVANIEFHAPPQHPGFSHDGTQGDAGYSSTPWDVTQDATSITWSTETFAQNPNANAIRFGTMYNFRFEAFQPPQTVNATVGFFKTGSPMTVEIQAPQGTPSPTPPATATPTPTPTPTVTPPPSPSPTPSVSPTPRPTPTPRGTPASRIRPTPHSRP